MAVCQRGNDQSWNPKSVGTTTQPESPSMDSAVSILDPVPDSVLALVLRFIVGEATLQPNTLEVRIILRPVIRFGATSRRFRSLVYEAERGAMLIWERFDPGTILATYQFFYCAHKTANDMIRVAPPSLLRLCQKTTVPITVEHVDVAIQKMPHLAEFCVDVSMNDFKQVEVQTWMDKLAKLPCRKLQVQWSLPDVVRFPPTLTTIELFTPVNFAMLRAASQYSDIRHLTLTCKGLSPICLGNIPTLKSLELHMLDDVPIDWHDCPRVETLAISNMCEAKPLRGFEQSGCRESVCHVQLVTWMQKADMLLPLIGCPKLKSVKCGSSCFELDDLEVLSRVPGVFGFILLVYGDIPRHLKQYLDNITPQSELLLRCVGKTQVYVLEEIFASRMCSIVRDLTIFVGTPGGFFEHKDTRAAYDRYIAGHLTSLTIHHAAEYPISGVTIPVDSIIAVMRACSNLRRLEFSFRMDMVHLSAALPDIVGKIEHLTMDPLCTEIDPLNMGGEFDWLAKWKALKSLKINDRRRPDHIFAGAAVHHCPLLQYVVGRDTHRPANLPLHIKYTCI